MKNRNFLFLCYALILIFLILGNCVFAQNIQQKRWVLNNQSIDFTVDPPVVISGLPQFSVSNEEGPANGIHDSQGNLLFYVDADKRVRNKYGNPIGQNTLGIISLLGSEICVVPVPEANCRYYLIYTNELPIFCSPSSASNNISFYSEIDLTLNNNLADFISNKINVQLEDCNYDQNNVTTNHTLSGFLTVGPLNINRTKRYLYKVGFRSNTFEVLKFEITNTGISAPTMIYTINLPFSPSRNAELEISHDGSKLAFALNNSSQNAVNINVIHLDPLSGNVLTTAGNQGNGRSIYTIAGATNRFTGLEFSPNGNNLFVGQENVGIHHLTLLTGTVNTFAFPTYGNSHLELAYDPAGNNKIYATDGTNLGRINDPNLSPNFQPNTQSVGSDALSLYSTVIFNSGIYQLPDQLDGFNYDVTFNTVTSTCCAALNSYNYYDFRALNSATWQNGSNPFNSTAGSVKIQNELRIPSGKDVIIQGMTFEFAQGAKVVIEKGAKLTLNNSTFTSTGCEALWQGIEVQGDVNESQLTTNPNGLRRQGHLIIQNNSLIENAKEAITLWQQGNLATAGGIVWATNSTFRNNWRSAEFISYQNYTPIVNSPSANISNFKDCVFETTLDLLNNGQTPLAFVTLWALDGVRFNGNIFRNTGPQTDITKRGYGIKA